jgi:hypothetical protein
MNFVFNPDGLVNVEADPVGCARKLQANVVAGVDPEPVVSAIR